MKNKYYLLELIADKKYVEWLKLQSWFSNYKQIYNIVVHQTITTNNSKTPEHNRLQNLFLDKIFLKNLSNIIKDDYDSYHKIIKFTSYNIEFEGEFNWDCIINFYYDYECLKGRGCCDMKINHGGEMPLFIEIKPILGDDYPCVLRKMKTQIELTKKHRKEIPREKL